MGVGGGWQEHKPLWTSLTGRGLGLTGQFLKAKWVDTEMFLGYIFK